MAGCALGTTFAKVIVKRAIKRVLQQVEGVRITVFVDDIAVSMEHHDEAVVAERIGRAVQLIEELMEEVGCRVAPEKTSVVASSTELAAHLRSILEVADNGSKGIRATFLGGDYAAGRPRRQWARTSKLRSRLGKMKKRRGRILRLRAAGDRRVGKLAQTGLLPQGRHAAMVNGIDDQERNMLQTTYLETLVGRKLHGQIKAANTADRGRQDHQL